MTQRNSGYIEALKREIKGDVYHDPLALGMYATDASIYQILPVAVVCPKDEADVVIAMQTARTFDSCLLYTSRCV